MFDQFKTSVSRPTIDLETVVRLTGLRWQEHTGAAFPDQGVYGWFHPDNDGLVYAGKGDGIEGLRARLSHHIRWRGYQQNRLERHTALSTEDTAWAVTSEVPIVRQGTEERLVLWFAVAEKATWILEGDYVTPETAVEWETFLMETTSLLAGSRSPVGGGAWENKRNTLAHRIQAVAWRRLMELGVDF
ncbi:MAG: hypothetical protein H7288_12200 [Kineosporiaceae bacterium]|nr:hypothetical protein [Aeromicrobium sp.]